MIKYTTMSIPLLLTCLILVCLSIPSRAQAREAEFVLNSASNLIVALEGGLKAPQRGMPFDITATIVFPPILPYDNIIVKDSTGTVSIKDRVPPHPPFRIGDVIHAKGVMDVEKNIRIAKCLKIDVLSHTDPPPPAIVDSREFLSGLWNKEVVSLVGVVNDVCRDEIDSDWTFLLLRCGDDTIYVASPSPDINREDLQPLIGAKVSITGLCVMNDNGLRRQIGYVLSIGGRNSIKILQNPNADPFAVPEIEDHRFPHPLDISMQTRHRTSGYVLAAWGERSFLIKRANDMVMRVELAVGPPPRYGEMVEVVGFPETDLYRINLSRAVWRPLAGNDAPKMDDDPLDVHCRDIIVDGPGRTVFKSALHGQAIRIKGNVRSISVSDGNGRIYMEDESFLVPVDVSARPEVANTIEVGCQIEATGICVMELENWRPNSAFPQIKGFMVVVRTPDDIRILSRPPWWTPGRLVAVIGTLLAALFGIFVWNRMLNRRAEQRGKELAAEQVAHVASDLKVYERTRLAVELHDSLSQNLTGVSLAIRAANRLADADPDGMRKSLGLAANTLDSCRDELRNCLWDLRNQTLEESDMNEAIRQTLAPHIGDAKLTIRFNVPRERLSDNTAHAILRIVRELATNAVRHGHATQIRIAGAIESGRLLFSVSDNGSGFDPQTAPGIRQGHFGLQGIRDRIDGFEGDFVLDSSPGKGTKAIISIRLKSSQMS